MSHRIFVTGTDTDVGKTYVAAKIVREHVVDGKTVGIYKPVASGCRQADDQWVADDELAAEGGLIADDAVRLWEAAGRPRTIDDVCPQRFAAPLAPNLAAIAEGKNVDRSQLITGAQAWDSFDCLVIEGAGGLFSPIADDMLNIDLIDALQPDEIVLVAADRIGVAHQVLVCLAAAQSRGIVIDRVILNRVDAIEDESIHTNDQLLKQFAPHTTIEKSLFDSTRPSTII